jgi:hypothetical protein
MINSKLSKAFATLAWLDHRARLAQVIDSSVRSWPFKGHADASSFLDHALTEMNRLGIRSAYAQACCVRALLVITESVEQPDLFGFVTQAMNLGVPSSEFTALHLVFAHLGQAGQVWLEELAEMDVLHCLRLRKPVFQLQSVQGGDCVFLDALDPSCNLVACDRTGMKGTLVPVGEQVSWLQDFPPWCQTRFGVVQQVLSVADFQQFVASCCRANLPESEWKPLRSPVFEQVRFGAEIHGRFIRQADYALFDAREFECQKSIALRLSDSTVQAQSAAWQAVSGIEGFALKGNAPLLDGALSLKGGWHHENAGFCFVCQGTFEVVLPVDQLVFHFHMNLGGVWSQCIAQLAAPLEMNSAIDIAVSEGQLQAGKPLWEVSRSQAIVVQLMPVLTVGGAVINASPIAFGELTLNACLNIDPQTGELDVHLALDQSDLVLHTMSLAPAFGCIMRQTHLGQRAQVQRWSIRHG